MLNKLTLIFTLIVTSLSVNGQLYHSINKSAFFSESSEARWYNLDTHIYQVCGEKTSVDRNKRVNSILIKPNCSYIMPTPPKQVLRINLVNEESKAIAMDELFVTVGNGQGAWAEEKLFYDENINDYILSGISSEPQWIKISWLPAKNTKNKSAKLSIFTFRDEKVPRSEPFATQISHATEYYSNESVCNNKIKECQCRLEEKNEIKRKKSYLSYRLFNQKDSRVFWPVDKNNSYWSTVYGPTKLRIDSQFLVNPAEMSRSHKYFYNITLNTAPFRTVEHESLLINSKVFYKKNRPNLLSEKKSYYIDIPAGCHRLRIKSIEPILIRVLAESHDYLFSRVNQSLPPNIKNKNLPLSWSTVDGENVTSTVKTYNNYSEPLNWLSHKYLYSWINHWDNQVGWGSSILDSASRLEKRFSDFTRDANLIKNVYHHFKDIFPRYTGVAVEQKYFEPVTLLTQHQDYPPALRAISDGYINKFGKSSKKPFFKLKPGLKDKLHFKIPKTPFPVEMKIMVLAEILKEAKYFYVQFEKSNPFLVEVSNKIDFGPLFKRWSSTQVSQYVYKRKFHEEPLYPLKYGTDQDFIFPSREASQVYLRIPADVANITIWTDKSKESWISPSVKMQNLRFLSEQEFKVIEKSVGQEKMWLWFVNAIKRSNFGFGENEKNLLAIKSQKYKTFDVKNRMELENIWLPLIRGLQTRSQTIKSIIGEEINRSNIGFKETKWLTKKLKKEKNIFKKISILSQLVGSVDEKSRDRAILEKSNLLEKSGKARLNSRFLTYHYYYTVKDPKNKELLYNRLFQNLNNLDELSKLKVLLSYELMQKPNYQGLRRYIELIFREENYRDSLILTHLLPSSFRSTNTSLVSALKLEWWELYKELVSKLKDDDLKHEWNKILESKLGLKYEDNKKLKLAKKIASGLSSEAALDTWSGFNLESHEYGVYKSVLWEVERSAGFYRILSDNEKVFVRPLATPEEAIEAELYGEADLQIVIRPIHPVNSKESVDGWVYVEHQGKILKWPIIDNKRSAGLSIFAEKKKVVGLSTRLTLKLEKGSNSLRIWSPSFDIIVDLKIKRPFIKSSPIPVLTRSAAEAFKSMKFHPQCNPLKPHQLTYILNDYGQFYNFLARKPSSEGLCNYKKQSEELGEFIQKWGDMNRPPSGKLKRFYEVASEENKLDINFDYKMTEYLKKVEEGGGSPLYYSAKARLYYEQQKNKIRHYSPAWSRLQEMTSWKIIDDVVQSVGVKSEKSQGWQTSNESQKMTAALSGVLKPEEQLLGGSWSLKIHTDSSTSSSLRIITELVEPSYLRSTGVTINYGVFEKFSKKIRLTNKKTRKIFYTRVPYGKNLFYMKLLNPKKGQYVKVTVQDKVNGEYVSIVPEWQKDYFITTNKKPIIISQKGPTLLRMDYKVGEEDLQKYVELEKGQQIHKIYPLPGEKESQVRVFKLVSLKESPYKTRPVLELTQFNSIVDIEAEKVESVDYDLEDELKLGGQEDGTWSLGFDYRNRFYSTNEPGESSLLEKFNEPQLEYRFFSEKYHVYTKGGLFHRLREDGFNTSGLLGHMYGRWRPTLQAPPFGWWLKGKQYFQRVQGTTEDRFQDATNLSLGIGQWRQIFQWLTHRPSLELFYNRTSMDGFNGAKRIEVDLDIFSNFKNNHEYGLKFGHKFVWQRWWDSSFEFSYSLWSNEELNSRPLDSLHFSGVWSQNWSKLNAHLSYHQSLYLEDDQRLEASNQERVQLKFSYDYWLKRKQRVELMVNTDWRPVNNESVFWLGATWHMGHGRGFKDYAPAETSFRSLRSRLSPKYNIDILNYGR